MDHQSLFHSLYAHFGFVSRTLQRFGVLSRDAPDVAQDVYLKIYQNLWAYDRARSPKPWLYGFAVRLAADYRRAHFDRVSGAPREDLSAEPFGGTVPSAEQSFFYYQMLERVAAALNRLELDLREVLLLHDVEQMTMPVIASTLGLPLNTGYSRLRRARERLMKQVSGRPARNTSLLELLSAI